MNSAYPQEAHSPGHGAQMMPKCDLRVARTAGSVREKIFALTRRGGSADLWGNRSRPVVVVVVVAVSRPRRRRRRRSVKATATATIDGNGDDNDNGDD